MDLKPDVTWIKNNISLINVINSCLNLNINKKIFFILCPFHNEKTESFYVNGYKNIYKCFGCNRGGDVITFFMDYKNINFYDAVTYLIDKFKHKLNINKNINKNVNKNLIINGVVADIYHSNLKLFKLKNTDLENFLKDRDINKNLIKKFKIGYASRSWNYLCSKYNTSINFPFFLENGLIIKRNKTIYDRFRNRIIFPIRNISGKIVGFGGRILDNFTKPKYINSPDSEIFKKSKELYGLFEFINSNRSSDTVIVVEGYMDVLAMNNVGISNVVGVLGTAFNNFQLSILCSMFKKIIFCYDGDKAGNRAIEKTIDVILNNFITNIFFGFVILEEKFDPDSFIKKFGKDKFIKLLEKPIYFLDYLKRNLSLTSSYSFNNIYFINSINNLIKNIKDKKIRDFIFNYFFKSPIIVNKLTFKIDYKSLDKKLFCKIIAMLFLKVDLSLKFDFNNFSRIKILRLRSDLMLIFELIVLIKKFHSSYSNFSFFKKIFFNNLILGKNKYIDLILNLEDFDIKKEFNIAIKNMVLNRNEKINKN